MDVQTAGNRTNAQAVDARQLSVLNIADWVVLRNEASDRGNDYKSLTFSASET